MGQNIGPIFPCQWRPACSNCASFPQFQFFDLGVGSMSHVERGKLKIVQFWWMRAEGEPAHRLTNDVTAVKWLPLQQAIDTLSRPHEKAFLVTVGQAPHQAAVPSAPGLATEHTRPVPEYNGLPKSNRFFESIRVWLRRLIS
jgi:hypothetical protein